MGSAMAHSLVHGSTFPSIAATHTALRARGKAAARWQALGGQRKPAAAPSTAGARAESAAAAPGGVAVRPVRSAREAALAYYENYNEKRMENVLSLIAEDCVYEDLIYQEPFVGKAAIAAYFQKVERLVPPDIKFVVEDITEGDGRKAGVRWHVELEGIQFPFSRGVSFYEVNDRGQIVFARDVVEPSLKPGGAALRGISFVAPLVRKLGPAADPSALKRLPLAAAGVWAVWAAYLGIVMLSPWPPGAPAWQASPETLQTVLHESFNFFYVNIGLAQLGLNPVPCVAEHPVSEAVFNAMGSWGLLFLPAMLADPRGARVRTKTKLGLWIGTWFLTNCFLPIYMALRLLPEEPGLQAAAAVATPAPPAQRAAPAGDDSGEAAAGAPAYTPALGVVALSVGLLSMWWAGFARPEYGALAERWAYVVQAVTTTRVDWAFGTDALLYSVWQYVLLGAAGAPQWQRAVPFFGMGAWALSGGRQQGPQGD